MTTKLYHFHVFNLFDSLSIKTLTPLYGSRVIFASSMEMWVRLGETSYLFVYRFGAVAFFGAAKDVMDAEIRYLSAALPPGLSEPTQEKCDVLVGAAADKVALECVELRQATPEYLRLVGLTLGQSAALAYFETRAARMLKETAKILERLAMKGSPPFRSRHLIQFIGSAAGTRQNIIGNLAVVDPPERLGSSKHSQTLLHDLQRHFDVETRFKSLDRNLALAQDNIGILSDLASSRKAAILEILIILLIVVEIVLGIWGK